MDPAILKNKMDLVRQAEAMGVPVWTIIQWIIAHGMAAVEKILPTVIKAIQGGIPMAQILKWAEIALIAAAAGQPLPPGP